MWSKIGCRTRGKRFPKWLPEALRKSSPGSEIYEFVSRFKCSELPVKQRKGQGSSRDVYTSEYKGSEDTKCQTVVIKKMLPSSSYAVAVMIVVK